MRETVPQETKTQTSTPSLVPRLGFAAVAVAVTALAATGSCDSDSEPRARGYEVSERSQLIGGPTALGDVGDYMLENDRVRVVVQDKTYNRGSGVFGGSLIDADLVRASNVGDELGGSGNDSFGEMFPAFFLEMIDPENVEVVADGSDGGPAIIEVRGRGGEFVTMLRYLNQLLLGAYKEPSELVSEILDKQPPDSDSGQNLEFSTRYILEPGARHIRIESKMRNIAHRKVEFPPQVILGALKSFLGLDLGSFRLPMGHVLGFGKLSQIFLPGLGYDIEQGLIEALSEPVALPAFPGFLTPVVASTNDDGVNYGFMTEVNEDDNFVYQRDQDGSYGGRAKPDDMLFLFNASGFSGVFSAQAPPALAPAHCSAGADPRTVCEAEFPEKVDQCVSQWDACLTAQGEFPTEFSWVNYLIIGDGDVASLMEEYWSIRETDTTSVRGRVSDEVTGSPVAEGDSVLVYEQRSGGCGADAHVMNQVFVAEGGRFELRLPDGKYCARATGEGRPLPDLTPFEVGGSAPPYLDLVAPSPGTVVARIVGDDGVAMPGKLTLVGTHDFEGPSPNYREFLVDEVAGEPWRPTDLVPDTQDPATRRYIEDMKYGNADGIELNVRPGKYTAYLSRGPEFGIFTREIDVAPGGTVRIQGTLPRVVDTTGYVTGDFHMHGFGSIDSGLDHRTRLTSIAGEGVELVVSTDHNYITDYEPYLFRYELNPFLKSIVGIELTTFEAGHFNSFPVRREMGSMNRGSFSWQDVPPQRIFDQLRSIPAEGQKVVIQVNHPRTPILGYFGQHNLDPFDATVELPINNAPGGLSADSIASPNGSAFIEKVEVDGEVQYRPTFSWDFDVIEVLQGPHTEEMRHFRMPFDKNAAPGEPDALPTEVRQGFRDTFFADLTENETFDLLAEFRSTEEMPVVRADIAALTPAELEAAKDEYTQAMIPDQWNVLCDEDTAIAAGALDDWYNLLNYARPDGTYKKYTATGNSDSHGAHLDEPGMPRNYFFTGHDEVEAITAKQLTDAMRSHHNIVSNGPFINMTVDGNPIGSQISAGRVTIDVVVRAADWVGADRLRIVGNGEVVRGLDPNQSDDFWGWIPIQLDENGTFEASYEVDVAKDTWFVLEVEGSKSMFPIMSPQDIPPFNFSDVIGSLAGAFGFGSGVPGLDVEYVFPITPVAFTNPVWVVADGDGQFTPPNPPVYECVAGRYIERGAPNALVSPDELKIPRRLSAKKIPGLRRQTLPLQRPRGETRDLRVLIEAWGGHSH